MFMKDKGAEIFAAVDCTGLSKSETWTKRNLAVSEAFEQLDDEDRREYARSAFEASARRRADKHVDVQSARNLLALQEKRMQDTESEFGKGSHLADARLSEAELKQLCDVYNTMEGRVIELRQRKLEAPDAVTPEQLAYFDALAAPLLPPREPHNDWLHYVIPNRDQLACTAFSMQEDFEIAWVFLYASGNPWWVVFLRLERTDVEIDGLANGLPEHRADAGWEHSIHFRYAKPFELSCNKLVPFKDTCDFYILYGLRYTQQGAWAHGNFESFFDFALHHARGEPEEKKRGPPRKKGGPKKDIEKELRARFPWLTDEDIAVAVGKRTSEKRPREHGDNKERKDGLESESSSDEPTSSEDDAEEDEAEAPLDWEAGKAELEAIRHDYHVEAEPYLAFRSWVMGGEWTFENLKRASSGQKGKYCSKQAAQWAERYAMAKERSFFLLEVRLRRSNEACHRVGAEKQPLLQHCILRRQA